LLVGRDESNRRKTVKVLRELGIRVEMAESGERAIELVSREPNRYKAMLIETQLPELDGCGAAHIIRTRLSNKTLPIVAMAAHVTKCDKQRFARVGINDLVVKPLDPDHLGTVLARLVSHQRATTPVTPRSQTRKHFQSDYVPEAIPGINTEAALERLSGNRDLFSRLLHIFFRDYFDVTRRIREALAQGDLERALLIVHTLKGAAGNLSATGVFREAVALEETIMEQNHASITSCMNRLEEALKPVVKALSVLTLRKRPGSRPRSSGKQGTATPRLQAILVKVHGLLKRNSLEARTESTVLREHLTGRESEEILEAFEDALSRMDFKDARQHLASLAGEIGVVLP
jgi:two-component system, sensor histidine kinase and response regulator